MLDTVEVLSHRSFASLLKQAKVLLERRSGIGWSQRNWWRTGWWAASPVGTASWRFG
jgi:hypothetical protein